MKETTLLKIKGWKLADHNLLGTPHELDDEIWNWEPDGTELSLECDTSGIRTSRMISLWTEGGDPITVPVEFLRTAIDALAPREIGTLRQPQPDLRSNGTPVHTVVAREIEQRAEMGLYSYNTYLRPHNGRNALVDLYQELLDAVLYLRQHLLEQDEP